MDDTALTPDVSPTANLATVLDEIEKFLTRYVVFSNDAQPVAITLWIAHTWGFEHAESTPYIAVSGPERRTGKTRLLEVLELLVHEPLFASSITPAAMFRAIDAQSPTLLLDETDSVFGPKANGNEDLRAVLNAGHRRGAQVLRMGGPRMTQLQSFDVFCPKVLAGIGKLPDTITDRSIPIRLQRKAPSEKVERFRRREVEASAATWREFLRVTVEDAGDYLTVHEPLLPAELNDRAQDGWEPLLAIADAAGLGWPEKARRAAVALHTGEHDDDLSLGVRLLGDVRDVFAEAGNPDKMFTADLLDGLHHLEEAPWPDFKGRPLPARTLARILSSYEVHSKKIRIRDKTARGYVLGDLEPACVRYLAPYVEHVEHPNKTLAFSPVSQVEQISNVPHRELPKTPTGIGDVPHVPDRTPHIGPRRENEQDLETPETRAGRLVEDMLGGVLVPPDDLPEPWPTRPEDDR